MDDETKKLLADFEKEIEYKLGEAVKEKEPEMEPEKEPEKEDWKTKYDELDEKFKKLVTTNNKIGDQCKKLIKMCDYMGEAVEKLGLNLTFDEIHMLI
jgi:hypothetical protein